MATIFRPPLFVQIYARPKAQVDYVVNLSVLFNPNPKQPFRQSDWPLPARAKPPQDSAAPANLFPLLRPNPSRPFRQDSWDRPASAKPKATGEVLGTLNSLLTPAVLFNQYEWRSPVPAKPKAVGEALGTLRPLLTPNPTMPFNQYEWRNPARTPLSLKSEVYFGSFSLIYPTLPFSQKLWDSATPGRPKAIGEPAGPIQPLFNPNPAVPFNQYEWRTPARIPLSLKSDSYAAPRTIYSPNPAQPFTQGDWPLASPRRQKARTEEYQTPLNLFFIRPFLNEQAFVAKPRLPQKSDLYVNFLPLYAPPFKMHDWSTVALRKPNAKVDDVVNFVQGTIPPPRPRPERTGGIVRDPLDRDSWGRFIPGHGYHRG